MKPKHFNLKTAFYLLGLTFFLFPRFIWAQQNLDRFAQERLVENRRVREIEKYERLQPKERAVIARAEKLLFSVGGWVDVTHTEFHNDDNSGEAEDVFDADLSVDTRLWAKAVIRHQLLEEEDPLEHMVYAQFRNFYIARWPNEKQPDVQNDNDGPHVDLLYADLDFHYAELRIGRQYLTLGQGIAYSNVHQGIRLAGEHANLDWSGFVTKTLPHEENIDYSVPGYDKKSERYFVGGEVGWRPSMNARVYQFFLIQKDESDPEPPTGQDYAYDSQHWGFGASVAGFHGFSSWAEYILETGSSAVFGVDDRNPVLAHAANVGMNYRFPWTTHPDLTLEYAFGSGDPDRISVTNTEEGNSDGRDHNFLYFGIYPTGYALSPTLSNIHIVHVGSAFQPFEKIWQLRQFRAGVDGYFYWKDEGRGGIYDIDATQTASEIGQELNATLYWPVVSDIILSTRFGIFFPGHAYPSDANDPEIYIATTATFSF